MVNVARMAMGMARPMMKVLRRDPRKRSTTSIARNAPTRAALRTAPIEARMKLAWFWIVWNWMSPGMNPAAARSEILLSTWSATSTVLALGCLRMATLTAGEPSRRAQSRCSRCVSLTAATSDRGTRPPPATGRSTDSTSTTVRNFPAVLPTTSRLSLVTRPAATSSLAARTASMICETVSP
jgi:hypothetical protein